MALRTNKSSDPPCMARQIATLTAATLHALGTAPPGCEHLPAGIVVEGTDSTVPLECDFVDASGTAYSMSLVPGVFHPLAIAGIAVTNVPVITVFWRA